MTLLVIVGPTASGKSTHAMDVARTRGDVEIVAVDAFTIYRGMDIGTAKPSAADRGAVRHHMLDLLAPNEDVSVAWFQQQAREAIEDIRARGRVPLLVGGSGLYFRAVVDDLQFPPTDPALRQALEVRWQDSPRSAHAHLAEVDPTAAERIEPGNLRRTVRALEVIELTGRRFSSFSAGWDDYRSIYDDLQLTYLEPDTDELRGAIDRRARQMVEAGLVDEVEALLQRFPGGLSATARQAIGYAETLAVLVGDEPYERLADAIAQRTWSYARRQRSWFRRDPRCVAVGASDADRSH